MGFFLKKEEARGSKRKQEEARGGVLVRGSKRKEEERGFRGSKRREILEEARGSGRFLEETKSGKKKFLSSYRQLKFMNYERETLFTGAGHGVGH